MPAIAPEAAVFAPVPTRRSAYDRVAVRSVQGAGSAGSNWEEDLIGGPAEQFWVTRLAAPNPPAKRLNQPLPVEEGRIRWLLDKALKEVATVRSQLPAKQAAFAGIDAQYVLQVAGQLASWLWIFAQPTQLTTTLTYDQSLHVRATLPHGAVHISVLFSPGIDPNATTGLGEEEEDNTIASVYDAAGQHTGGAMGPLPEALRQLAGLLPIPAGL